MSLLHNSQYKILDRGELVKAVNRKMNQGERIALATGCFDVLHVGHIELLETAADHGSLFVGINSDEAVRSLKGFGRPVHNQMDRARMIAALRCVHVVFIIPNVTVVDAINTVMPQVWVKGGDWTPEKLHPQEVEAAKKVGAEIVIVPRLGHHSSTAILSKR